MHDCHLYMSLVLDDTLYPDVLPAQVSASSNVCIVYQYSNYRAVSIKTLKKWFQESSTKPGTVTTKQWLP